MAKETKTTTKRTTTKTANVAPRKTVKRTVRSTSAVTKDVARIIPSEDQIRARAHEIWLRRAGAPGDAHSDWLQAERELIGEMSG